MGNGARPPNPRMTNLEGGGAFAVSEPPISFIHPTKQRTPTQYTHGQVNAIIAYCSHPKRKLFRYMQGRNTIIARQCKCLRLPKPNILVCQGPLPTCRFHTTAESAPTIARKSNLHGLAISAEAARLSAIVSSQNALTAARPE
jgi:hypothetical protein